MRLMLVKCAWYLTPGEQELFLQFVSHLVWVWCPRRVCPVLGLVCSSCEETEQLPDPK